ncbi:MAG: hypothetical protein ACREJM_16050, partial [Candidatus Saccharimonadales bacterium]
MVKQMVCYRAAIRADTDPIQLVWMVKEIPSLEPRPYPAKRVLFTIRASRMGPCASCGAGGLAHHLIHRSAQGGWGLASRAPAFQASTKSKPSFSPQRSFSDPKKNRMSYFRPRAIFRALR